MKSKNNQPNLENDIYYMYGHHPVIAAIQNDKRIIYKIYCNDEMYKKYKRLIDKHSYEIVTNAYITKILGQDKLHQGLLAKVKSNFHTNIEAALDPGDNNYRIAILDQISDSQNIGAIVRSAAAFNINALIFPINNSPNENGTIAKIACGALEQVKITRVVNLRSTIDKLKAEGFWIIGLSSRATDLLEDKIIFGKVAFILGSEDKGLRHLTEESCDYLVKLPIAPAVESLNVANTAAIAFYLSYKQKLTLNTNLS